MLIKCDGFWSYITNEDIEMIGDIKHYLTHEEYDYQTKSRHSIKFYTIHSRVADIETIKIPTGLCDFILKKFNLEVEEQRGEDPYHYTKEDIYNTCKKISEFNPDFETRDYQVDAMFTSLSQYQSLIYASVGAGKTSIMATVVKMLDKDKILIVNDNGLIVNQIYDRLLSIGIPKEEISNDISDLTKHISVLSSDMLYSRLHSSDSQRIIEFLEQVNTFINDECQHIQAVSIFAPILYMKDGVLRHVIGYSGSPFRDDKRPYNNSTDKLTISILGEPAFSYELKDAMGEKNIAQAHSYFINYNGIKPNINTDNYFVLYNRNIQNNWARNKSGVAMLEFLNQYKLKTLALFNHIDKHALPILLKLSEKKIKCMIVRGGAGVKKGVKQCVYYEYLPDENGKLKLTERTESIDELVNALKGDYNIILASSILNEGVDISLFDAGVLFSGGKSPISITQQLGRVSRKKHQGLNVSLIIDFKDVDCNGMFIHQYTQRKQLLAKQGVKNFENVQDFIEFVKKVSYNKYNKSES